VRPSYHPQTAYVRARIDGLVSGYFEWMGAASYTSDQRTSAMHGKQFLLDAVYAGLDADSLSGRLDFHASLPEGLYQIVVNLEVSRDPTDRSTPADSYRLIADAQGNNLLQWVLSNGDERNILASSADNDSNDGTNEVEVAMAEIFEMRLPFRTIGVQPGSRIRLRFTMWRDQLPADSLPVEGWIDLFALAEEEITNTIYTYAPQ
jgi:hypothetical protein